MRDFSVINKEQIWDSLRAGKQVFAVVLYSHRFDRDIYNLRNRCLADIMMFYKEDNTIFIVKKEEQNHA